MDKSEAKEMAVRALDHSRGDDLARARACFNNMSAELFDRKWGQSGMTPRQILQDYEKREQRIDDAIIICTLESILLKHMRWLL